MRRLLVLLAFAPLSVAFASAASCSGDTPSVPKDAQPEAKPDTGPPPPPPPGCDAGLDMCKGACIDLQGSDVNNCGACGKVCAMGATCTAGRCSNEPGDVAAGGTASYVVILDGSLYAWGGNAAGQLAEDPNNAFISQCANVVCRYQPVPIQMFTKATRVAAGWDHACAIDDGKVWCWGSNDEGQLGHDPTGDPTCGGGDAGPGVKCKPTPTEVTLPAGKAVDVAAGKGFTCVRNDAKDVYCWGTKTNGVTGRAGSGFDATPNKLTFPASDVEEIAVAGGTQPTHGCARRTNGDVWCWGKNDVGQLGQASPAVSATPVQAQSVAQAQRLALAENVSCTFRANGTSICWGSHARGGLGTAKPVDTAVHAVPESVNMRWGITAKLFAGGGTVWAFDSVENAYVWGANPFGTFGDQTITGGSCGNDVCDPNTKAAPQINGYRALSGSNHVLGISKGGKLFTWGQNKYGQLGKEPGNQLDQTCAQNTYCNPVPTIVLGLP